LATLTQALPQQANKAGPAKSISAIRASSAKKAGADSVDLGDGYASDGSRDSGGIPVPRNVVLEMKEKSKELVPHWYKRCVDYYGGHGPKPTREKMFGVSRRVDSSDDESQSPSPEHTAGRTESYTRPSITRKVPLPQRGLVSLPSLTLLPLCVWLGVWHRGVC